MISKIFVKKFHRYKFPNLKEKNYLLNSIYFFLSRTISHTIFTISGFPAETLQVVVRLDQTITTWLSCTNFKQITSESKALESGRGGFSSERNQQEACKTLQLQYKAENLRTSYDTELEIRKYPEHLVEEIISLDENESVETC